MDGGLLIGGLFEGEAGGEGGVLFCLHGVGEALTRLSPRVDLQKLGSHISDALAGLASGLFPLAAAQFVQRGQFGCRAAVAADQLQGGDRYIEFVATGVFQAEKLILLLVDGQLLQTDIAADAVLFVYHRRSHGQFGQIADDVFCIAGTPLTSSPL